MNCHGLVTWAVFASGLFRPGDHVSCSITVTERPCLMFTSNTSPALGRACQASSWVPFSPAPYGALWVPGT